MREHGAGQPPASKDTRTPAVDFRDAADHPQAGGQRGDNIRQGKRHDGRDRGDLPCGGLNLARGAGIKRREDRGFGKAG